MERWRTGEKPWVQCVFMYDAFNVRMDAKACYEFIDNEGESASVASIISVETIQLYYSKF